MSTPVELTKAKDRYARLRAAVGQLADEFESLAANAASETEWSRGYRVALLDDSLSLRALLAAVDS